MAAILETLPGLPMSVREVTRAVESMWDVEPGDGGVPLSEFRASQMNLVLHFGAETSVDEGNRIFAQAIAFARVYPCRILLLEERLGEAKAGEALAGKLFSQCYVGRDLRDLCCCEALMLAYPRGLASLVEHQASLWLEADLPVYYWLHRIPAGIVEASFGALLKQARRVVFDRGIDGAQYAGLTHPPAERRRDLLFARSLRLRQTLGQILSSVPPAELIRDLVEVEVASTPEYAGKAAVLLDWLRPALQGCARAEGVEPDYRFSLKSLDGGDGHAIAMNWRYAEQDRFLNWHFHPEAHNGMLEARFGSISLHQPMHIEPLDRVMMLAEALFFG